MADPLPDGSHWPTAEQADAVAYRLRFETHDFAAASIVEAYLHLLTYPLGVEHAVRKIRALRRRERERAEARRG